MQRAKDLAHRAHAGQVDKAGRPYIEHVARVAATVEATGNMEAVAAAWLHDCIEDHPDREDEAAAFLPDNLMLSVLLLNRDAALNDDCYYTGIRSDHIAFMVKLADLADNMDESRLALLPKSVQHGLRRTYAKAIAALTGAAGGGR